MTDRFKSVPEARKVYGITRGGGGAAVLQAAQPATLAD